MIEFGVCGVSSKSITKLKITNQDFLTKIVIYGIILGIYRYCQMFSIRANCIDELLSSFFTYESGDSPIAKGKTRCL